MREKIIGYLLVVLGFIVLFYYAYIEAKSLSDLAFLLAGFSIAMAISFEISMILNEVGK